jgi:uncharacterized RDD family membrane protein YckC
MKCPKCGYLGFEDIDRCRNCGYDFSLVSAPPLPELSIRDGQDAFNPLDDLALVDAAAASNASGRANLAAGEFDRPLGSPTQLPTPELPLFGPSTDRESTDDTPLITRTSPPRPPLAVRRATPEVPRLRSSSRLRTPMLDLNAFDTEPEKPAPVHRRVSELRPLAGSRTDSTAEVPAELAGIWSRAAAAAADVTILACIDIAVVYLTMKICGLEVDELGILPKGPLLAFLTAQNLAYFVGFTVGGQTLGKMAAGIKVISVRDGATLDLGRSVVRTLVWVALAVPAGLGFLTALFGDEHRGFHDRCAGTKVVRASA